MNKKQSSIEYLEKLFYTYAESGINSDKWIITENDFDNLIQKAKEMHKEEIIDAYTAGSPEFSDMAEEFYYDTYETDI